MIRAAVENDLGAMTAIYNHYVETSHATFDTTPFTVQDRRGWFDQFDGKRWQCWIRETDGVVEGYSCTQPFKPKAAYETSVEVSIYLHPDYVGRGLAQSLYDHMLPTLAEHDLHRAYAIIALPNPASVALHEAFGFRVVGTLTEVGRKFDRYWDVMWMQRELGSDNT